MRKATKVLVLTLTTPLVATVLLNNPAQYVHWSDRAKSMTLLMGFPWGEPCETHHVELETDGKRFHYTSEDYTPSCIRYDPPRMFTGIWWDEFEGEAYWDFARALPLQDSKPDFASAAWLDFDPGLMAGRDIDRSNGHEKPWRISFMGRKTSVPGRHCHFGQFSHNIIVERIVSMETMPLPKSYKRRY